MDILHNLEITRIKGECESRIEISRQKMLVEQAGRGDTAEECLKLKQVVYELRDQCDEKLREAREKREEEIKAQIKLWRSDLYEKRDKEEARIYREY